VQVVGTTSVADMEDPPSTVNCGMWLVFEKNSVSAEALDGVADSAPVSVIAPEPEVIGPLTLILPVC
jgi:hypothetical protein